MWFLGAAQLHSPHVTHLVPTLCSSSEPNNPWQLENPREAPLAQLDAGKLQAKIQPLPFLARSQLPPPSAPLSVLLSSSQPSLLAHKPLVPEETRGGSP